MKLYVVKVRNGYYGPDEKGLPTIVSDKEKAWKYSKYQVKSIAFGSPEIYTDSAPVKLGDVVTVIGHGNIRWTVHELLPAGQVVCKRRAWTESLNRGRWRVPKFPVLETVFCMVASTDHIKLVKRRKA